MLLRFISVLFFLGCPLLLSAQDEKEIVLQGGIATGDTIEIKAPKKFYDPKIASKRSAFIPGWGQIYNDSWWKVPIIYGGFGIALYYVNFNNEQRLTFLDLLAEERAKPSPDPNRIRIFSRQADTWQRNRDLVIVTMLGIYLLQIVEATVDAHLKGFNVDEELALNLKPAIGSFNQTQPFVGFKLTLPIGR